MWFGVVRGVRDDLIGQPVISIRIFVMAPSEIASYLALLLRSAQTKSPLLQFVAEPGAERDHVIAALLDQLGGGFFLTPGRAPHDPLSFEKVLALLRIASNLAIEDAPVLSRLGISVEALRREVLIRQGTLIIVSADDSELDGLRLEGNPRGIIRARLGPADLRVALTADWDRGQIRIPRDGCRPELVTRDVALRTRVGALVDALIQAVGKESGDVM